MLCYYTTCLYYIADVTVESFKKVVYISTFIDEGSFVFDKLS